jgi:SpoIID/LytB domain protein
MLMQNWPHEVSSRTVGVSSPDLRERVVMDRTRSRTLRRAGGVVLALAGAASVAAATAPAGAETLTLSSAKSFTVQYRGNGHGHGMSQYGARGAAMAGKGYKQILAFYYPGTTLTRQPSRIIRVRLTGTGSTLTIKAQSLTTVTGVKGYLPTAGVSKYRLIADARSGLTLQKLGTAKGATWTNVRAGLPNRAEFYRHGGVPTRLYETGGTSTDYDGYLRAVRSGSGVYTVDRVVLDLYTAGVVPREMPASWQRAAVDAQAVAARTYGANAMRSAQSSEYDICATTQCQVYGGHAHYDSAGRLLYSRYLPAASDTSNQVLTYKGAPIFAQFSASNGGWTVAGGQPYLVAKADPYDTAASGDPYIDAKKTQSVSALAKYFGLAKVSKIALTQRDGHGTWSGRVLTGYVAGTDSKGKAKTVPADSWDFQDVFGLGTTWFRVLAPAK